MDQETFEDYLRDLDIIKKEYILDRAMEEYHKVEESADRLLRENGVDEIDRNSPSYCKLCEGLILAEVKGTELQKSSGIGVCLNVNGNQHHDRTFVEY